MSQDGLLKIYGRLAIIVVVLGMLAFLDKLFTGPLAFVSGMSDTTLGQWVAATFAFALVLLVARIVKPELLPGLLPQLGA